MNCESFQALPGVPRPSAGSELALLFGRCQHVTMIEDALEGGKACGTVTSGFAAALGRREAP